MLRIHERVLAQHGSLAGVRDVGLLSAAVMMPRQSFAGAYLHDGPAGMAAAYLFHLCNNHPFLDGNRRAPLAAALTFLIANGETRLPGEEEAADTTLALAAGATTRDELTAWLRRIVDGE